MNRYDASKAFTGHGATMLLDGKVISRVIAKAFTGGLHEALIGAEVIGYAELYLEDNSMRHALVVRRRRPFIPFGTDPKLVNKECGRLFAMVAREQSGPWVDGERFDVVEVTPS